ncbi:MAG: hypothetical protein A2W25_07755 [candidate division Zixibacteria bacterium RBG_16_53_22]|nr:MAG: hypothetical protein A2W25_07755 [candidate division Zixibacteria bacterium RBG_16_53_22]
MRKVTIVLFSLTVIISGLIYAITLCPTVEFIDSGELAMACKHLGIAHPTGYPLYTLLGNLAARIPAGSLIIRENVLSLLLTSLAAGFLFLLISRILQKYGITIWDKITAAPVALFAAFSPIWWSQGTTNEVYSLNLLLISMSLWLLFNYAMSEKGNYRWLAFSVYSFGLCLTNHLSAIYAIPGIIYVVYVEKKHRRFKFDNIWKLALFLLFPLSLYFVLPIRARFSPFLNWGDVSDPYFFYKHVTGWQYRVWMFTNPLGIFENLPARVGPAAGLIYDQFKWFGLPFIALGIVIAWRRYRRFLIFCLLIWLANLIYVLNYDIVDIEAYYLPMIFVTTIFIALTAAEVIRASESKGSRIFSFVILTVLLILPAASLLANFHKSDRSRKVFARQGVLDMAASIEPKGIAIVENWDFYSPWLYMRFEENFRPDMVLLDKELMRRSWYIDFIRRYHPDIYDHSRQAFEEFLEKVESYDRGKWYNPYVLDEAYYGMFNAILQNEASIRPIYTNMISDKTLLAGQPLIPGGIMFRFDNPSVFQARPRFEFAADIWGDPRVYKDKRVGFLLSFYSRAFESRQKYCLYFGKDDEAAYYGILKDRVKVIVSDIR